jgi:hypothetical protein
MQPVRHTCFGCSSLHGRHLASPTFNLLPRPAEHPGTSERVAAVQTARAQGGPTPAGGAGVAPPVAGTDAKGSGDPEWLSALLSECLPEGGGLVAWALWLRHVVFVLASGSVAWLRSIHIVYIHVIALVA